MFRNTFSSLEFGKIAAGVLLAYRGGIPESGVKLREMEAVERERTTRESRRKKIYG